MQARCVSSRRFGVHVRFVCAGSSCVCVMGCLVATYPGSTRVCVLGHRIGGVRDVLGGLH